MAAYVAATGRALADAGIPTRGFRGVLSSSLPRASGLSSSAALELAAAWALVEDPMAIPPLDLARICQRAENVYVGVNCGLMDQFASACGVAGAAMLLDCRSLDWRPVALPLAAHTLVAIHTGSTRSLKLQPVQRPPRPVRVRGRGPGNRRSLDPLAARRDAGDAAARAGARRRGDVPALPPRRHRERPRGRDDRRSRGRRPRRRGQAWAASHASLRDDYEVVSPELDTLVEIAAAVPGVVAARMTGAGFGGCTINVVRHDAVERVAGRRGRAIRSDDRAGAPRLSPSTPWSEPVASPERRPEPSGRPHDPGRPPRP